MSERVHDAPLSKPKKLMEHIPWTSTRRFLAAGRVLRLWRPFSFTEEAVPAKMEYDKVGGKRVPEWEQLRDVAWQIKEHTLLQSRALSGSVREQCQGNGVTRADCCHGLLAPSNAY